MEPSEETDRDYYYRRAEQELELAQRAADQAAVKSHYQLAGYYLDLVYSPEEEKSPLGPVAPAVSMEVSDWAAIARKIHIQEPANS